MLPLEAVAVDAHAQPFRRMAAYNASLQSEKANKEEKTHVCMNFTKKSRRVNRAFPADVKLRLR